MTDSHDSCPIHSSDRECHFYGQSMAAELGATIGESYVAPPPEPNPRVEELANGALDDFFAADVESVHFEALDDCQWYANVKLNDGQLWTLNFGSITGRAKGYANAERVE